MKSKSGLNATFSPSVVVWSSLSLFSCSSSWLSTVYSYRCDHVGLSHCQHGRSICCLVRRTMVVYFNSSDVYFKRNFFHRHNRLVSQLLQYVVITFVVTIVWTKTIIIYQNNEHNKKNRSWRTFWHCFSRVRIVRDHDNRFSVSWIDV